MREYKHSKEVYKIPREKDVPFTVLEIGDTAALKSWKLERKKFDADWSKTTWERKKADAVKAWHENIAWNENHRKNQLVIPKVSIFLLIKAYILNKLSALWESATRVP